MTSDFTGRYAETEILVPFHDVDSTGIVWHGCYAKYFEVARCILLDGFNYGYREMEKSGYSWPIVDLHMRYFRALTFDQRIRVRASLAEWEYRLRIKYLITDAISGAKLTRGRSDQVAVDLETQHMCLPSPPILLERLGCCD